MVTRAEELEEITDNRKGLNVKLNDKFKLRMNLVYSTLSHRGITNMQNFIKPTVFKKSKVNDIENIEKALELEKYAKEDKNIGVLVDVDCDGMTSSAMLINYLNDVYRCHNIYPIIPHSKLHGIKSNIDIVRQSIKENSLDYIVSPDSSTNDSEQIGNIIDNGIKVLVIDHHNWDKGTINLRPDYIISNQSPYNNGYINHNFTGVGMVYSVLKYLDNKNGCDYASGYLDLFAIGQIGDMSDISDLEIRSLMLKGFNNIQSPLLNLYNLKQNKRMTPKDLQFGLIPLINSVMRVGTQDDKDILLKALIKDDSEGYQIKKRKIVDHHFKYYALDVDIFNYAVNKLLKVKSSQTKMVNKALKNAEYKTSEDDNINLAFINDDYGGITGLIANKLLGDTDKATFILHGNDDKMIGSMRIPMQYTDSFERLRANFKDTGLFSFAEGHENAAGISLILPDDDSIKKAISILNKMYLPVDNVYNVDDFYINDTPRPSLCHTVDDMSFCFGGRVNEPVIAVLGLNIKPTQVMIKGQTLHININGIEIVKFKLNKEEKSYYSDIVYNHKDVYIDVVGTIGINRFLNNEKPQLIAEDIILSSKINSKDYPNVTSSDSLII